MRRKRQIELGAMTLVLRLCILAVLGSGLAQEPSKEPGELIRRFDLNRNGKIDVSERKEYVRERARLKHAEAKRLAAMRPKLTSGERLFLKDPDWTPEKTRQYDANKNGILEPEERMKERQAAAEIARAEFKKADRNGDGHLNAAERKAAGDKIQRRERLGAPIRR